MSKAKQSSDVVARMETVQLEDEVAIAFPRGRHRAFCDRPAKVDVLVPVFNGGENIERCVSSALGQTSRDLHVVVVDNASTDETFARCCRLAEKDDRVLVYQNASNVGRVPNWNRALSRASAEYAKLLMVNDVLLPTFVEELVAALDANPSAVMARASLSLRGADGKVQFLPYFAESVLVPAEAARRISLGKDNLAGCPAAQLIRRAALGSMASRFDESLGWAADYDFSTRLFEQGGLAYVRKPLFVFDASAARFFNAGDLVLRFRDECTVRTKAALGSKRPDRTVLLEMARAVDSLFGSYFAQASSLEARTALERVRDEAQKVIRDSLPCEPRAGDAVVGAGPVPSPRVSVIIPCYKQAHFLPEAVASLVAQTYADWECIVVDDGSPDDTAAVADALAKKYAGRRIQVVHQTNRGLSEARNVGVRSSRGRYVLPLDADDCLGPAMLANLVEILDAKPEVAIAFTHAQCFGVKAGVWKCGPFTLDRLLEYNRIPYCSLYRRGVWQAVGGYNPNLTAYEDWDFWIAAAERGFRAQGTEEALFHYRTKAVSMLTEADARKPLLVARIILNHPNLFGPQREAQARTVLAGATAENRLPHRPAVSVVVLRRSGGEAFAKTLSSVLGQAFQDFEVVVVNASDESAEAQIREIDRGGRVRGVHVGSGESRSAARNAGIALARGRWLTYADEGDVVYADHLLALVAALEGGGASVAYGDAHRSPDTRAGQNGGQAKALAFCSYAEGDVYLGATRLPLLCLAHERELLAVSGGFDESLGALEEWDFQIRLLAAGRSTHVSRPLGEVPVEVAGDAPAAELAAAMRNAIRSKHRARFDEADRRRNGRYAEALSNAERLAGAGDVAGGIRVLEAFVRAMPYWAKAHNDLATLYHASGRLGEALVSVVAALELEPQTPVIRQNAKAIEQAVLAARAPSSLNRAPAA